MNPEPSDVQVRGTAESLARRSYGKLVALLSAGTRDIAAAEDALSEAFVAALERWPRDGCPANPEAWLVAVARRKVIDSFRQRQIHETAVAQMPAGARWFDSTVADAEIPDRRLGLMFACAHPAIDRASRAPLMLQAVLGLSAAAIASAFLVSPATMGQRLVRAKGKIKEAAIPFDIPSRERLADRLEAVLDAIYAAFAEGWGDPGQIDAARRELAEDAIYLGGVVCELLPQEPEALGLLALMFHCQARRRARRDPQGEYLPLDQQNISLWDAPMIDVAEALLFRARALGRVGRFQLEAALQSAHVDRRRSGNPNWPAILQLYDALLVLSNSPVVVINRALAVAEVDGPEAALESMSAIVADPRLAEYQPYWATRAELLARIDATAEAHRAYEAAIGLERDSAVRRFLQRRQADLKA